MRGRAILIASLAAPLALGACNKADHSEQQGVEARTATGSSGAALVPQRAKSEQVAPPFDLKQPPGDAIKTASGLVYKKVASNDAAPAPKRNDTVMINETMWNPATGQTLFTNRSHGKPMPVSLATTATGFAEALQLLHKGEKGVFWVPAAIGYKVPPPHPEDRVYEFELTDIQPAPAVPADVAKPPDSALKTKSGIAYVVVRPGTGKDKPKPYDDVTYAYTGWDATGRMFDTTEMMQKSPAHSQPYRAAEPIGDVLAEMTAGERVRFWVDADKMQKGKPVPDLPKGQLCYEIELQQLTPGVEPPKTPPDVAKPPADAKKTAKGVFYKVLHAGKGGPHPTADDTVKVNYSGWTTDGKMFDSSVTRKQPAQFNLRGVIPGWTDAIPLMSVGDKYRFWIPEELAYKGQPGRPQGMLVFDVELLEIVPKGAEGHPGMSPHPGMPPHPGMMPPHPGMMPPPHHP